ncbi:MAG: toll/interleukin-1 receptor domain-containing protein [Thiotrichaceae bacterium]|nr:toll/interleukin-1 receptor domain-containing protein [Thiotrichaceae bacterium]
MPDELLELMQKQLLDFKKALILETDAGVKFKLKHEIKNLEQQLAEYQPALNPIPQAKSGSDKSTSTVSQQDEIFISYKWRGESERIVNELDKHLMEKGLTVIRDKRDLGFKGKIKEFMQRIGRGRYVVVVISDKYLKSDNCMFELLEIAQNGDFYDRIFPIVLADADIYKPVKRLAYVKHWENEIQALNEAMKEVSAANLQGFRDEIDLYTKIRERIASLTDVLKNMNTLTPEMHEASGFEKLYQAIEDRRTQDR